MYMIYRMRIWYYRRQARICYTKIALAPIGTNKSARWLRNAKLEYNSAVNILRRLDPANSNYPIASL